MKHLMEEELCRENFDDRCSGRTTAVVSAGKGIVYCYTVFDCLKIYFYEVQETELSKIVRSQKNHVYLHYCYSGGGTLYKDAAKGVEIRPGDYGIERAARPHPIRMKIQDTYTGVTVECNTEKLNQYFSEFFGDDAFDCGMRKPYVSRDGKFRSKKTETIVLKGLEEFCRGYQSRDLKIMKVRMADILCRIYGIHQQELLQGRGYIPQYKIQKMEKVRAYLKEHFENAIRLNELAEQYHVSLTTLKTSFKEVYGVPVYTYLKMIRMEEAEKLLLETEQSITEIASKVGYSNASKFSEAFREQYGICPSDVRRLRRFNHLSEES